MRVGKSDATTGVTYYLRSSVLGGQVVGQLVNVGGVWQWNQGYVYLGGQLLATQHYGVNFVHEDPITKSKRVTDISGNVLSTVETDPWGADTSRSGNAAFQPRKFTSYERDANGSDDAMFRRYNRRHGRFDQPDPYNGSYNLADPQSFNRYAYVGNDPVNFTDPSGLYLWCVGTVLYKNKDGKWEGFTGTCTWIDDRGGSFQGGGQGARGPQNSGRRQLTADELAAIRKEFEKMLTDKCKGFIDKLVSFNTGQSYNSGKHLLGYVDSTANSVEGGIFFRPGNGTTSRQRHEDYAKVFIGAAAPVNIPRNAQIFASTLLHEIIHALTYGSDDRLSSDIQKLGIVPIGTNGKPLEPPTGKGNDYSGYWETALQNACFPNLQ